MNPALEEHGIPVVTCPRHVGHRPQVEVQCGRAIDAFDTVARMQAVEDALSGDTRVRMVAPRDDQSFDAMIRKVHESEMVDFLAHAWSEGTAPDDGVQLLFADTFLHPGLHVPGTRIKRRQDAGAFGQFCFDTITGIGPDTFDAALGAASCALTAASHTIAGSRLSVALSRPPGHHVSRNVFGGGSYLNNAAIAAQWLRDHGVQKVAIVDVDFHHGNGTQAIFYGRSDVVYTSLHGHPDRCFPYFSGYEDEVGTGEGRGATLNVPLPADIEGPAYLSSLDRALSAVSEAAVDVVVVSLGFDTGRDDPAGDAKLDSADYFAMGQAIGSLGLPVLAVLEGGYAVSRLGSAIHSWVSGAAGDRRTS